jgi:TonB family protein
VEAAPAPAAVGAGPTGGGGSEAGTGAPRGDALAAYIAGLQRAIDAQKSYPPMARRRGIEGVVTVRLAIDALGALEATSLVGRPPQILARSARDAVARAGPFPPPPGGRLQVEFPVRYEIVD